MNESNVASQQVAYDAELADLRARLGGRNYCKEVEKLLPNLSPWQIRNVVNGRGKNDLVLSALKIVVFKMEKEAKEAAERLLLTSKELGMAAA